MWSIINGWMDPVVLSWWWYITLSCWYDTILSYHTTTTVLLLYRYVCWRRALVGNTMLRMTSPPPNSDKHTSPPRVYFSPSVWSSLALSFDTLHHNNKKDYRYYNNILYYVVVPLLYPRNTTSWNWTSLHSLKVEGDVQSSINRVGVAQCINTIR